MTDHLKPADREGLARLENGWGVLKLWFFRDLAETQRSALWALWLGKEAAAEATQHGVQLRLLKRLAASLAIPPKAERVEIPADRFANDAAAKAIYDGWSDRPGWVPWVERGNSNQQEEARRLARANPTPKAPAWRWWAGTNEEDYDLAGQCLTREDAIDRAYGGTEPGDTIYLVEAISEEDGGRFAFVETRNHGYIIREEDALVKPKPVAVPATDDRPLGCALRGASGTAMCDAITCVHPSCEREGGAVSSQHLIGLLDDPKIAGAVRVPGEDARKGRLADGWTEKGHAWLDAGAPMPLPEVEPAAAPAEEKCDHQWRYDSRAGYEWCNICGETEGGATDDRVAPRTPATPAEQTDQRAGEVEDGEPCCDCGLIMPSASCVGEKCWCGAPAAKKVGEEIAFDDPEPHRHNLTSYVCARHYAQLMGPVGAAQVGLHPSQESHSVEGEAALREALQPLADVYLTGSEHDEDDVLDAEFPLAKHVRAARAALGKEGA